MDYECILAELCEEGESVLETTHDVAGPGFAEESRSAASKT